MKAAVGCGRMKAAAARRRLNAGVPGAPGDRRPGADIRGSGAGIRGPAPGAALERPVLREPTRSAPGAARRVPGLLASVSLLLTLPGPGAELSAQEQDPVALGERIYRERCEYCHGAGPQMGGTLTLQARYQGALPALLTERTDLPADYIEAVVRTYTNGMAAIRPTEVSDTELDALAAFLTRNNRTAAAADIVGRWNVVYQTPMGDESSVLTVEAAGDGYRGVFGDVETAVTLLGNQIGFAVSQPTPMGTMQLQYSGVVSGNAMQGAIATPMGPTPWTATRIE